MNKNTKRILALVVYLLLIFLPLIMFFVFPMPPRREAWRDLSVMLGFVGLSIAGLQFLPTARIPFLSDVFDLDGIYSSHHLLSLLSIVMVFMHPVLLLVNNPYTLLLLNPITAPWRAQAGIIALFALVLIAITSVLRKELRMDYNRWHIGHDILAMGIAVFALIHLVKVNYYMAVPAMQVCWIIQAVIWIGMTVYVRILKPLSIKQRPYFVDKIVEEIPGTWSIFLKPLDHPGLSFNAGQVAWLNINTSPFTLNRNPFSISGSAHKPDELRFSIKNAGDFTKSVGELKGGETVYVDGPYGEFSVENPLTQKGLVLLAGGIGAAPIMSILHTLADGKDERSVWLFYGNYDDENITFMDELIELEKQLNLSITHVLEVASQKVKSDGGFISQEILERDLPADRDELFYFVCGPLMMIETMEKHLKAIGIPQKQITSEKYEMA
jgi:predicted ferric reductase